MEVFWGSLHKKNWWKFLIEKDSLKPSSLLHFYTWCFTSRWEASRLLYNFSPFYHSFHLASFSSLFSNNSFYINFVYKKIKAKMVLKLLLKTSLSIYTCLFLLWLWCEFFHCYLTFEISNYVGYDFRKWKNSIKLLPTCEWKLKDLGLIHSTLFYSISFLATSSTGPFMLLFIITLSSWIRFSALVTWEYLN